MRELGDAAVLNPDGEIDILRAHVFINAGDPARAKRVLWDLLAREPKNVDGWILMYFTPPPHNPDSRLAAQRLNELVPPVPAGH